MKDNDLIALFASKLEEGLALSGWDVLVVQAYQPTQEGVAWKPQVSFEKLFDHEYGWPTELLVLNKDTPPGYKLPDFSNIGRQWVESTFQVTSLALQDVHDLTIPTPSDIAHFLKIYINMRQVMEDFRVAGASVLRITDIRNAKFEDDRDQFESSPSFDVVLQHVREIALSVPGSNEVHGTEVPV